MADTNKVPPSRPPSNPPSTVRLMSSKPSASFIQPGVSSTPPSRPLPRPLSNPSLKIPPQENTTVSPVYKYVPLQTPTPATTTTTTLTSLTSPNNSNSTQTQKLANTSPNATTTSFITLPPVPKKPPPARPLPPHPPPKSPSSPSFFTAVPYGLSVQNTQTTQIAKIAPTTQNLQTTQNPQNPQIQQSTQTIQTQSISSIQQNATSTPQAPTHRTSQNVTPSPTQNNDATIVTPSQNINNSNSVQVQTPTTVSPQPTPQIITQTTPSTPNTSTSTNTNTKLSTKDSKELENNPSTPSTSTSTQNTNASNISNKQTSVTSVVLGENATKKTETITERLAAEYEKIEEEKTFLTALLHQLKQQVTLEQQLNETGQTVANLLRDYSSKVSDVDPSFSKCVGQAGEMMRYMELLRSNMNDFLTSSLIPSINGFMNGDLRFSLQAKKEIDDTRNRIEKSNAKIKTFNAKGKVNLVKLSAINRERDELYVRYKSEQISGLSTMTYTNHTHAIRVMEDMSNYLEQSYKFFLNGESVLGSMQVEVEKFRGNVVIRRQKLIDLVNEFDIKNSSLNAHFEDDGHDKGGFESIMIKILLDSERMYKSQLESITRVYLGGILSDGTLFTELVKDDVTTIFSNIETIAEIQGKFWETLFRAEPTPSGITAAFTKFVDPMFDAYIEYFQTANRAQECLEACKKKSKNFVSFLKVCDGKEKDSERDLSKLLSAPMGRVRQYCTFFEELVSRENLNPELKQIFQYPLERLSELSQLADRATNWSIIKPILDSVESPASAGSQNDWALRKLYREGPLLFVTPLPLNETKDCHFYLFNDLLFCVKRKKNIINLNVGTTKTKQPIEGLWKMRSVIIKDIPDTDTLKHCIQIIVGNVTSSLVAESEESKKQWLKDFSVVTAALSKGKIFGVNLDQVMQSKTQQGRDIPSFISSAINELINQGLLEEGIFRLSGSANDIEALKEKLERGQDVQFKGIDYHVVSGLVKLFIRSLPEPLISYNLYDLFLNYESTNDSIGTLKGLLGQLPQNNRFLLQAIFKCLNLVVANEQKNKMSAYNLSIVFGPILLRKKDASQFDMGDSDQVYKLVQFMITNYHQMFTEIEIEREHFRVNYEAQAKEKRRSYLEDANNLNNLQNSNSQKEDDNDDEDEESIESLDATKANLSISLKEIVKTGYLEKKGEKRRNWTKRFFVVKPKYLFYFKSQGDKTPKGVVKLTQCRVGKSDRKKPFCFAIVTSGQGGGREYMIAAKNQTEMDEWIAAIKSCIEDPI